MFYQIPIRETVVALLAIATFITTTAAATGPCCCFCQKGRCEVKVEKKTVEVPCFETECETICIPPVRFPWQCGPLRTCGKVRRVNRLVLDSREETVCVYDWSAKLHCCPQCCRKCCQPGDPPRRGGCLGDATERPVGNAMVNHQGSLAPEPKSDYFADRSPELATDDWMQVTLVRTIEQAKPQEDGWIVADNPFERPSP